MSADLLQEQRQYVDQFHRDGSKAVTLCSDMLFYLAGSPAENQEGLLELYGCALDAVESSVTFAKNGDAARYRKRPKDLRSIMHAWFDRNGPSAGSYVLRLESGGESEEPSDRAFEFLWVMSEGSVRLMLPAGFAVSSPLEFAALALRLSKLVNFRCGSAGLAVNMSDDYTSTYPDGALARVGERFPGVDLDQPLYWNGKTKTSIKTVNWLTFLGHEHLARAAAHVGGEQKLAAELGQNVAVTRLPHGVMIQAGAAPGFGDTMKGETLPEYRQVARALRGLKIPPEVLRTYDGIGGTENTRKWLNRFD